jgi:SAM-dependent methyltransferase
MLSADRVLTRVGDAARACATAWRRGGASEVGRLVSDVAYWRYHPRVRRWRAELPRQQAIDDAFDARFGVETASEVALSDVGVGGADLQRGHGVYRPVWTDIFHRAVGELAVDFARFAFVDYGSGKGKALLLAADYPFREIVGVEFARPLHDIAARNIALYSSPTQRCHAIRSACADALAFEPPGGPLVGFFFNPFDDATTDGVIAKLVESVRRDPRDVFVIYCNMRDVKEHGPAFERRKGLRLVTEHPLYLTFRVSPS